MAGESAIVDLLGLIESHGAGKFRYAATTGGGEYWGMCPFCDQGKDRFHVWPHGERPHYWCRVCGASGDAIQFLRDYLNMSYAEACEELGLEIGESYSGTGAPGQNDLAPVKKWQDEMLFLVEQGNKTLLAGSTALARQYRHYLLQRCITLEQIEKHKIAFVGQTEQGKWLQYSFEQLGLTEDMLNPAQLQKGCVRIPDGLLFPYFVNGDVWKVGVKRPFASDGGMPRGQILGSKECWLNQDDIRPGQIVVVTEAYLDALSIESQAGDLVIATSTDGTSNTRSLRSQAKLQYADGRLLCFDADDAGDRAAQEWLSLVLGYRLRPAGAKDANEMLTKGLDLRAWVQAGLMNIYQRGPLEVPVVLPAEQKHILPSDTVELASSLSEPSVTVMCFLCTEQLERYTVNGTPCCQKHYDVQQAIELAMAEVTEVTPSVVLVSPEEWKQRMTEEFTALFGPCEMQLYTGMTTQEIIAQAHAGTFC